MELPFTTLDVFTSTRFEGNPLAVVRVPPSLKGKLSQEAKQKIAKEFNLSETVFMHEPASSSQDGGDSSSSQQVHIDIFTVESELPFAGHPTIGSAVLAKFHLFPSTTSLITKAGPISLVTGTTTTTSGKTISAGIPHNVHLHARTLADVIPPDQHATYPGLSHAHPEILAAELAAPVFSCVKGMTFVLVRLPSLTPHLSSLSTLRLDFDALPSPLLDEAWSPSFVARYYYVDQGLVSEGGVRSLRTRMLELGFEDPATGSAASALAGYLTISEGTAGQARYEVVQGVEMGRRSVINVTTKATAAAAGFKLDELWLGGEAVVVMNGSVTVEE